MKLLSFLSVFLVAFSGNSATYYVATNGNNAADGSLATPWSNIWFAASTATAGDLVVIQDGEYNEWITNKNSGTAGNPITFTGSRSPSGDWLTIIDPSTPFTNGWVAATEVGTGVWKQTNMPFATRELSINHKRLASVYTNGYLPNVSQAYISGFTNGTDFLLLPTDGTATPPGSGTFPWWDGIEAIYCSTGNLCYLRLRDGSDPNGLNIRCSPNDNTRVGEDLIRPAVTFNSKSYIVYSNLLIRGAFCDFFLENSSQNVIISNYLSGGFSKVTLYSGTDGNTVAYNEMTADYYGTTNIGAWEHGTNAVDYMKENLFLVSKYVMCPDSICFDMPINISHSGNSNLCYGNHIFKGLGTGIAINGISTIVPTNTYCYSNRIENIPDAAFRLAEWQVNTRVYDNDLSDCDISFRPHHINTSGEQQRSVYVYRNRIRQPDGLGEQMYIHFVSGSPASFFPTFWFYHNSFQGGGVVIVPSGDVTTAGGITNFHWVNNVFSGSQWLGGYGYGDGFLTNAFMVGTFDYNLVTPPWPASQKPAWFGANNVTNLTSVWTNTVGMSFALPTGCPAIGAAVDVTQTFTAGGASYPALPADPTEKIGLTWDMGALESGRLGKITTIRVGTLRGP